MSAALAPAKGLTSGETLPKGSHTVGPLSGLQADRWADPNGCSGNPPHAGRPAALIASDHHHDGDGWSARLGEPTSPAPSAPQKRGAARGGLRTADTDAGRSPDLATGKGRANRRPLRAAAAFPVAPGCGIVTTRGGWWRPKRLRARDTGRHGATVAQTTQAQAETETRYGLPLIRARSAFVPPELWKPALVASQRRADPGFSDAVPGNPWRYEVFTVPAEVPRDTWGSWVQQEGNPELRAEAERQNTCYAMSLELGRRLLAGELQGWGRLGSPIGSWTEIPAEAWHVLRVPYEPAFAGLQRGHLSGPGMEFWGVRIRDLVGLSLKAAALAYGPDDAAAVAQRAAAFAIRRQSVAPATRARKRSEGVGSTPTLAERMRDVAQPSLSPPEQPSLAEAADAIRQLERHLVDALRRGALVATGQDARGALRTIKAGEWAQAAMHTDESAVTLGDVSLHQVRVRQAERDASEAVAAPPEPKSRSQSTAEDENSAGGEMIMRRALQELQDAGRRFAKAEAAHPEVLRHLGKDPKKPPRGHSLSTFRRAAQGILIR